VLNTGGANLPKGDAVPTPSKVVWAEPVDLTLSFTKAPKAMRVISLDSEDNKIVRKLGEEVTIRSPKRFEVVIVDL
jgi:hypothetical protein